MGSRRLTIFPNKGHHLDAHAPHDSAPPIRATKRRFHSGDRPVDLELIKGSASVKTMHKVFTPIDEDPGHLYKCISIVDPDGGRPYCLAQERDLQSNECPYRIVMVRRSTDRAVFGTTKPHSNLLNIIRVFRFDNSIFTVFDRPGLALSEIAVSHSREMGLTELKTISREVRL